MERRWNAAFPFLFSQSAWDWNGLTAVSTPGEIQYGVVAVVSRDDRFLMIRRAEGIVAGGWWCFVGGGMEPGESEQAALVREFREELGGEIVPHHRVWDWTREDGGLRLYWWQCELADGALRPNPAEVSEFRWLTVAEIARLTPLLSSNLEFVRSDARRLVN